MNAGDFRLGHGKGASHGLGEMRGAPDWQVCVLYAALFISGPRSFACRSLVLVSPLTGESLSLACPRESNQREGHPDIRPRLRRGSLASSPLQGHAVKGHPWPITALAASMPLNPFHADSTRPPEGDLGVVCTSAVEEQRHRRHQFQFREAYKSSRPGPVRRPSRGVA